ncbi:related to PGS1-phosphatidylglycerophosphate synthase [Sporisorium reilianum f. sp. reilianum]|uniref:CDP-diacylglycerol--glycerol-3-phosphate 3-phosphatidyltransferase n=1 Tax=Sporisorium reilianum f. sp. reilianum TaxID=72559 RepID=A0A2N8U903_9BASI|nr:related to PGS1-phosphatidylglycerophosphate synthase [Sporisorium reilianum f. sp. reilianum]
MAASRIFRPLGTTCATGVLPRRLAPSHCSIASTSFRTIHTSVRLGSSSSPLQAVKSNLSEEPHFLTRRLADELRLPLFAASGDQLHLLKDPSHFYQTLKDKIGQAKERIFLASLYIGKEETELIEHLESALRQNLSLQLTILVDALRGTRESAPTPSCASLVSRLQAQFPDRVSIRLYHTPNLKGWLKKVVGKRFNEGWGLQHMKIYGFDDDVVLSGANLSRDYFTNRRDRYLLIEGHEEIADYLHSLVQLVGQFSFKLEAGANKDSAEAKETSPDWKLIWDGGKDSTPALSDQTEMQPYPKSGWTEAASNAVEEFTTKWHSRSRASAAESSEKNADTLLLPLLQMGPLKIRQETRAILQIIELALDAPPPQGPPPTLALTSGYFSLYEPYKKLLLRAKAAQSAIVKIICAAPEANGFFQSRGVSGWIPEAYTWYEYQFWRALRRSKRLLKQDGRDAEQGGVEIREWKKNGWTYHAKGIWFYPSSAEAATPTMVHVGSSNYGSRSADLDLECTFLISTHSKQLSQKFKEEYAMLEQDAKDLVDGALFQRPDRKVRRRVRIASRILKGML